MSDSVRPHRRQPTRLPRPWDSPGKNTGVGCHFLLQCIKVKSESVVAQLSLTLRDPMDCRLPGSSVHGIFQARVPEWIAIVFSTKAQKLGLKNTLPALDLPSHLKDPDNTPLSLADCRAQAQDRWDRSTISLWPLPTMLMPLLSERWYMVWHVA